MSPKGVDPTKDLDIVVTMAQGGRGDADLDGLDASQVTTGTTDYLPSAGWVDDDQIAILTWGSSTCAPVVGDVTASDPKERHGDLRRPRRQALHDGHGAARDVDCNCRHP